MPIVVGIFFPNIHIYNIFKMQNKSCQLKLPAKFNKKNIFFGAHPVLYLTFKKFFLVCTIPLAHLNFFDFERPYLSYF